MAVAMHDLFQMAADELNLLRHRALGVRIPQAKEGMGRARVDIELSFIPRRQPTRVHEQAVVEKCIPGSNGKKRRT